MSTMSSPPARNTTPTRDVTDGGYCRFVRSTRFVVQLHDATTLHFDLRIQAGQVLRSWAVPKGPSLDPAVRRLAVPVEDHELSAGEFEGVHGGPVRGSGAVIIWDEGPAEITRDEPGHLTFTLHGSKLAGGFALTRTGERRWILVKTRDKTALPGSDIVAERPSSVRTGRTWEQVASQAGPGNGASRNPGGSAL
jgi:DNA ligase D-like protein (predicted 3'-phosphoesterase)